MDAMRRFNGQFTQQEALSEDAIEAAVAVMRNGRLHRYNTVGDELSETAQLELDYARYQGARYCLACASGGYALHIALKACGLEAGETVLTNAFTLAPVPGAIAHAGGQAVFVEVTEDLVIDLEDLETKIKETGSRFLMLSHMRGHLVDMDRLMDIVDRHEVILVEDCAHTMGAAWKGKRSGSYGRVSCFSTQTYKHINSGEGGFLTTDDPDLMARAILLSGSYMLYDRHPAAPGPEHFEVLRYEMPNCSGRMDNLRAAILRPQLADLDRQVERWNERYRAVETGLRACHRLFLPDRPEAETYVGSSIQFLTKDLDEAGIKAFLAACSQRGVELKWFGAPEPAGYTSRHDSWRYATRQNLPKTDAVLSRLCDMRIPLTFSVDECRLIGELIAEARDSLD